MATDSIIALTGVSTRELTNDVLSLSFTATKDGSDSGKVQSELREAVREALEVVRPHLKDSEIEVQTDGFQVSPRYNKSNKVDGYLGSASITVKGTDTAGISKVASQIKTMVVSGSRNSMSRALRASVESELTQLAIDDFRAKADDAAKGFGAKGWTVGSVNIRVNADSPRMGKVFELSACAAMGGSDMEVEGGKSEITANVSGTIILKKTSKQ